MKTTADQIIESIQMKDLSGRLILKQEKVGSKTTEISLASSQKGAYILEIHFANSTQTKTIIRE